MKYERKNRAEILDKYVNGKLSEKEREAFDEHCFNCEHCFGELMYYEETADLIKQEGKTLFSAYLAASERKKSQKIQYSLDKLFHFLTLKPWQTAIAGAGLATVMIIVMLIKPAPDTSTDFEILPYLEGMLSDVSRSESVNILSPETGEVVQNKPVFKWEGMEGETVYLIILDNLGNERFAFTTDKNQFVLPKKLIPGLYYWKLETEDDLLFLGKFVVR
ncbi:zf-HC2 domain-containing protein [bacterium]|nr:zf-HC2 domain-containing protein [bacterium]